MVRLEEKDKRYFIYSFSISLIAAIVIRTVWRYAGIPLQWGDFYNPHPEAAIKFFYFWIPATYFTFSIFTLWIRDVRLKKKDLLSYLFLPFFILLELFWRKNPHPEISLGAFYLGVLFLKSIPLFCHLYQRCKQGQPIKKYLISLIFLLFALFSAWSNFASSSVGDEPYYLIVSQSLVKDHDFDLANNFKNREYQSFYWPKRLFPEQNTRKTKDGKLFSITYNGFGLFLSPAYALLKRFGAMLMVAFFTALTCGEIFSFSCEATKSKSAAFFTTICIAFTSPILFFSSQIYPETTAAFFTLAAVRRIRKFPSYQWFDPLCIIVIILILPVLQTRFIFISLILILLCIAYIKKKKIILATIISLFIFGGTVVLLDIFFLQGILFQQRLSFMYSLTRGLRCLTGSGNFIKNGLALLFDQEFGLLPYSPLYLLPFFGLPFAWKRGRRDLFLTGSIGVVYLFFLGRFGRWYAGFSPPSRYIVCLLPLTGFLFAHAFKNIKPYLFKLLTAILAIWSFFISFVLLLKPFWKYNDFDGSNKIIEYLGRKFSVNFVRFLPSFNGANISTYLLIALFSIVILLSTLYFYWQSKRFPKKGYCVSPALTLSRSFLILFLIFLAITFVASRIPTSILEGESMLHSTGIIYTGYPSGSVWVMKKSGEIWDNLILRQGKNRIKIIAGGLTTDDILPRMSIFLDNKKIAQVNVSAGKREWRRGIYTFDVDAEKGRHVLKINFENGVYGKSLQRILYIDKILILKLL